MAPPRRFLVLRFSSLGDIVLTTPLLRALRRALPDAHIAYGTKAAYASVLDTNPNVDHLQLLEPGDSLRAYARRLEFARGMHVIDLHGNVRTMGLRMLLKPSARSSYRKYRRARRRYLRGTTTHAPPHIADSYFTAVQTLGIEPDVGPPEIFTTPTDRAEAAEIMGGDYAVLAPGAARPNKRWPAAHWADLARLLGRQGLPSVAVGLPHEAHLVPPRAAVPCFDRSVRVAAALCEGARVVITNDSGMMHVAGAVGANAIALFGPTAPQLGFAPRGPNSRVMERTLPCRPCSILGSATCPEGHHRCLVDISPAHVADEVMAAV